MEWVGKLVPHEPPEGLFEWDTVQAELDVHGLIYEAAWVSDTSMAAMLDEGARGRKIKAVKVRCSFCGGEEMLEWCQTNKFHGGYGFLHPEHHEVCGSGDETLCPFCGVPVRVKKAAEIGQGIFEPDGIYCMSADVVGTRRLLSLTCWKVVRAVDRTGTETLRAKACEAYVFSPDECAKLVGWVTAYSGNGGYFKAWRPDWSQPRRWRETWGEVIGGIYGLTPELIARSCLPNCKLDRYMESFSSVKHKYPVAYLRLFQCHPSVENLLVSGLPLVLDDLLDECMPESRWEKNVMGLPPIDEIDWQEARPAQMLGLTREELRLGQAQCWGALFWRLFTLAKAAGEHLTGEDIQNAYYLGEDQVLDLVGRGPVGKSLRYLLKQIQQAGPGAEDEYGDPIPEAVIGVPMLLDYWKMCRDCERNLADSQVRWPRDLVAAHDRIMEVSKQRRKRSLAAKFRQRRKELSQYILEADGLLIIPAGSQADLDREAKMLEHCVWTYGEGHANGDYAIFFIRRSVEPKTPYYTLQLDEKALKVKQNRGCRNCGKTPEIQAFEDLWVAWLRSGAKRDQDGQPVLPKRQKEARSA